MGLQSRARLWLPRNGDELALSVPKRMESANLRISGVIRFSSEELETTISNCQARCLCFVSISLCLVFIVRDDNVQEQKTYFGKSRTVAAHSTRPRQHPVSGLWLAAVLSLLDHRRVETSKPPAEVEAKSTSSCNGVLPSNVFSSKEAVYAGITSVNDIIIGSCGKRSFVALQQWLIRPHVSSPRSSLLVTDTGSVIRSSELASMGEGRLRSDDLGNSLRIRHQRAEFFERISISRGLHVVDQRQGSKSDSRSCMTTIWLEAHQGGSDRATQELLVHRTEVRLEDAPLEQVDGGWLASCQ